MENAVKVVIHYKDFLKLSDEAKHVLSEIGYVEYLVSIKKEEYKKLSNEEKDKLRGFRRTELEPLKKPIVNKELMFKIPEIKYITETPKSFKEKHKRDIKQYVPKNIINQKFNSKKKGGR